MCRQHDPDAGWEHDDTKPVDPVAPELDDMIEVAEFQVGSADDLDAGEEVWADAA